MQPNKHHIPEDVLSPPSPPMREDLRRVLSPDHAWERRR